MDVLFRSVTWHSCVTYISTIVLSTFRNGLGASFFPDILPPSGYLSQCRLLHTQLAPSPRTSLTHETDSFRARQITCIAGSRIPHLRKSGSDGDSQDTDSS